MKYENRKPDFNFPNELFQIWKLTYEEIFEILERKYKRTGYFETVHNNEIFAIKGLNMMVHKKKGIGFGFVKCKHKTRSLLFYIIDANSEYGLKEGLKVIRNIFSECELLDIRSILERICKKT